MSGGNDDRAGGKADGKQCEGTCRGEGEKWSCMEKRDRRMEVYIGKVVCSASHVANMQMCCGVLRVLCAMRRCGMACGT